MLRKRRGLRLGSLAAIACLISIVVFVLTGYDSYISQTVFYNGMRPVNGSGSTQLAVFLCVATAASVFVWRDNYLPKIVAWIFYVWANLAYSIFYEMRAEIVLVSSIMFVLFCLFLTPRSVRNGDFSPKFLNFCFWITVFTALYFFASNGFKFNRSLLAFEGVYDVRWEVTEKRNFLENILFSTTTKLFSLISLASYLNSRRLGRALITAESIILLYSTSAQKSIMFFAAITVAISWPRTENLRNVIALGIATGTLLLAFLPVHEGSLSYSAHSALTRRLLLIPAWLNESYFKYFDGQPMLLRHSILNGIVGSYEGKGPTWDMGYALWGFGTSLNNGILSDGFMNFGIAGSTLYLAVGYATILFQAKFKSVAARSVLVVYIWQLTNSALITTFVTHGLAAFVIVSVLYFKRETYK